MSTIFKKLLWRSGLSTQLAKSKLLPGEAAVTTDDNKAYICTSSGHVEQLATHEQLANILDSSADAYQAMLTLLDTFEDNPSQLTTILNAISTLTTGLANANSNISDNSTAITQNSNTISTLTTGLAAVNNNLTTQTTVFTASNCSSSSLALVKTGNVVQIRGVFIPSLATCPLFALINNGISAGVGLVGFAVKSDGTAMVPLITADSNGTVVAYGVTVGTTYYMTMDIIV